jgi:hypothetical protein
MSKVHRLRAEEPRSVMSAELRSDEPRQNWQSIEGSPLPRGASWIEAETAYNFALYSKHAEAVTLLLYGPEEFVVPTYEFDLDYRQTQERARVALPDRAYEGAGCAILRVQRRPPAPRRLYRARPACLGMAQLRSVQGALQSVRP